MNLSQFPDLDLPVFDTEERIHYLKPKMPEIEAVTTPTVLRRVSTYGPDDMSVMERIHVAEKEFERVEELCGSQTVPHEFGLYPTAERPHLRPYEDSRVLPKGFMLAARVAVIQDVAFTADVDASLFLNKRQRKLVWPVLGGIFRYRFKDNLLIDLKGEQFSYGRLPDQSDHKWILHDIEPRIRIDNDPHDRKFTRP